MTAVDDIIANKRKIVDKMLKIDPLMSTDKIQEILNCVGGIGHSIGPSFKEIAEEILKEKGIVASK